MDDQFFIEEIDLSSDGPEDERPLPGPVEEKEGLLSRVSPSFEFDVELPDFEGQTYEQLGSTPVCYVSGEAGTGKTTLVRQALLRDPTFGKVTATTGVAAINLGGITLNSALGYSTNEVLRDNLIAGYLRTKLNDIRSEGYRWLIVDEASMLSKKALDHIMIGLRQLNEGNTERQPLGAMLIADFGQLPPIGDVMYRNGRPVIERGREKKEPAPWVFLSEEWPLFESNMIKLDKVYRQADEVFLKGINAIRRGVGNLGVGLLKSAGVEFRRGIDDQFEGTTIMAMNTEVDTLNEVRLRQLPGKVVELQNDRWSARKVQPGEWKNIPDKLRLKENAYVMVLTNDPPEFTYVNGDCGWVREFSISPEGDVTSVGVELVRNGQMVYIPRITRKIEQRGEPDEGEKRDTRVRQEQIGRRKVWVMGELNFWPIRLAYGSTVHKSQGLSLDRVQINPTAHFFGAPNLGYVAVSRARTPQGLVIVGTPDGLAQKIKSDPKCKRWL